MPDDNLNPAGLGHNKPPLYDQAELDSFRDRAEAMDKGSQEWAKTGIQSDEDATKMRDFIKGVSDLKAEVNAARVAAKKPHDEKAQAVQNAFKPILDPLSEIKKQADELLTAFQRRRAREEREKAEAEARKIAAERKAAEEAARKAEEANNHIAKAEMEAKAKAAEKAEKAALKAGDYKIGSYSGAAGTYAARTQKKVTIDNAVILATYYVRAGHPGVMEALQKAAEADVRAKDVDHSGIPGITVTVE